MQTSRPEHEHLPGGTRVLNTNDGEAGVIMNGFAFHPDQGGWTEYEVETHDQFIAVVVYDPQQGDIFEEGSRVFLDLPGHAFHVLPRRQ